MAKTPRTRRWLEQDFEEAFGKLYETLDESQKTLARRVEERVWPMVTRAERKEV